jgi:multidrug efflux pump subunit AcrA (membrane-fusion protein)
MTASPNKASMPEPELLPQEPPPAAARWMALLLITMFMTVLTAAVFVHIPETVRCPFVLVSDKGADPIQSPVQANVNLVKTSEGREVQEGEELFVLRSDEIRSWQTQFQADQQDLTALQKRIAMLDDYYASQLRIKEEEIKQIEREVEFREKHLATTRDFLARNQKLANEKLVSEVEILRHQLEVAESEKDLNVAQRTVQQVSLQRRQLETERARQQTEEQADQEKLKARVDARKRQLENCSGDLMMVKAPYHGVVISLAHRNIGGVVHTGDELCQVARIEGTPSARLFVREPGMPRLAAMQEVRLFFDAFPYQRYGTIHAKLDWISPATVATADGAVFTARAILDTACFSSRGHQLPVRAGMKGEARIIVGDRTAVEYIFEPVRQLREQTQR